MMMVGRDDMMIIMMKMKMMMMAMLMNIIAVIKILTMMKIMMMMMMMMIMMMMMMVMMMRLTVTGFNVQCVQDPVEISLKNTPLDRKLEILYTWENLCGPDPNLC